ncbi:erythrocyte binding like protein 1, fragment [Plasmodium reichenowi]|uniref:Erythrocyte binding like protein 1 n=1 Tax=Plasmodium reichenowi TaxID=5854 RepID=A0A060RYK6_PLARE|nr:erythrocyte binding like protein 1, fragment [Plasmodium reichenowi]
MNIFLTDISYFNGKWILMLLLFIIFLIMFIIKRYKGSEKDTLTNDDVDFMIKKIMIIMVQIRNN